ncbi:MAG: hypothetical protein OXC53_03155, partial [Rhodobacteraceae bacterium]|nr:hypothetical protein [Paracoccaceae bacterium]
MGDELADLAKFGSVYRILVEREPSDILGKFAQKLQVWDVTTVFPLGFIYMTPPSGVLLYLDAS